MQEDKLQTTAQAGIERFLLLFYFICNAVITVVTVRFGWPVWVALLTDMGWCLGLVLYCAKVRTYTFRAYVTTCLMQMGVILWSVYAGSFSMTAPVLSVMAVMLVFYGISELLYVLFGVTVFLGLYHILIQKTEDLASGEKILQTALEIVSVFFIEYIVYILNRMRMEGVARQKETIDSLREAERSKDDFMANVSHEIRTPINTICGMSEIVLREELSDQVRADVFSIQTAGRSLQSIVSDVLDFTEMQTGKMELVEETYNITSTINDVINMSMARKNEKEIDLIVDCDADLPGGLVGDEQKIRRVIMNLVNNALKFTVEGCVTIVIGFRKTDYGINLIVQVRDTGIGMKKESLEKLFNSFNQVDTKRNRQKTGIGLGLAISQALVERMGGFITVSSEFGRGSEVQFVIPQKVADASPIAAVKDRERVNVAIYVDMERYDRPEVREAYGQVIFHMISQLRVRCHVCQNLSELKRRAERETFTHVFISIEEYEEDRDYFDRMSQTVRVVAVIERFNDVRVLNPRIQKLYKPFFILPIVMALNDERMVQGIDASYDYQGRFTAPDAAVLIVDDNLMNIRVLEGLLQPYRIRADIATGGAEALEKIEGMGYDLVFMDHMMPEMDGVETLQRIRRKQGSYFKKLPVVAVTANAVGGMREVFLNEGFQDFIAKPIEISVLERVLRRVLPQEKLIPVKEETKTEKQEREPAADRDTARPARRTDLPADVFDEQKGLAYCGTLKDYIEILRLIRSNGPADRRRIEDLYQAGDWKEYATLVHALKSTMLSVGVAKLSAMAKELELAGKREDEGFIRAHHEELMREYRRVLDLLNESQAVGRKEQRAEAAGDTEELEEGELDKLAMAFEDAAYAFDKAKMEELAGRLSRCSFHGRPLAEAMEPVARKLQMSDYLSAAEAVLRLKDRIEEYAGEN